jgi:cyclopropane fatty-acyl-phospholipid synthase-like methyltransferase
MVFEHYSTYYDHLYSSKEYFVENSFILDLSHLQSGSSILDIGCGTGGHSIPFAKSGFNVTGIDFSKSMLEYAEEKNQDLSKKVNFQLADARHFRDTKKFDLVISLFAVMSYQNTNSDLEQVIQTARYHLDPGWLFIFDAWYGPAVLKQQPETRVAEISLPDGQLFRIARPQMHTETNTVDVNYTLLKIIKNSMVDETNETHTMRYFFLPEIEYFAEKNGFKVIKACPFMHADQIPTENDWNVTWVLEAI